MSHSKPIQTGIGLIGAVAALGLWQFAATVGPLAASSLPAASDAVTTLVRLTTTRDLWLASGDTIYMAFVGLVLAAIAGVLLGVGIGVSPFAMHATRIPLEFLKPIPPIVILPIAVLVLGPTPQMGVFLVFFGCFVAIAVQASAGVFDTDPVARATGLSYGMNRTEILRRIVLPSALPYIGTAIRVAAPTSLVVAVVAGLLGGGPGLGQNLLLTQISGNQDELFAYVLVLGILGMSVQTLSQWAERRLLHWHPQYRMETH